MLFFLSGLVVDLGRQMSDLRKDKEDQTSSNTISQQKIPFPPKVCAKFLCEVQGACVVGPGKTDIAEHWR